MNSSLKIILVMAAVFFGMMLLTPNNEDKTQATPIQQEVVEDSNEQIAISEAEKALIPDIVKQVGVREIVDGKETFSYVTDKVALHLIDGRLSGTVTVDSLTAKVDSALVCDFPLEMNVTQQTVANATLAKELKEIGTHKKFAPLL